MTRTFAQDAGALGGAALKTLALGPAAFVLRYFGHEVMKKIARAAWGVVTIVLLIVGAAEWWAPTVEGRLMGLLAAIVEGGARVPSIIMTFAARQPEWPYNVIVVAYAALQLLIAVPVVQAIGIERAMNRRARARQERKLGRVPWLVGRLRGKRLEQIAGKARIGWQKNCLRTVALGDERTMHMHIVGATGSGKTEALKRLIEADVASGYPVIWIDGKGDTENAKWFAATALQHGRKRDLRMFMPIDRCGSYNPLAHGDPTELKDRLVSSFTWSEEYYKGRAQVALQAILTALRSRDLRFDLRDVAVALDADGPGLRQLIAQSKDKHAAAQLAAYASSKEWQLAVSKVRDDLALFVSSSYKDRLLEGSHPLDFRDIYQNRGLAYVQLPVARSPEFMTSLGKLMMSDLNGLNSSIATGTVPRVDGLCSVIIDEFANFVTPQFVHMLREARSQRFALTIAHQSLGDLRQLDVADQIQGNTNTKLIFRQDAFADADNWAKLIGTKVVYDKTYQTEQSGWADAASGRGSLREVHQFIVEPDTIKNMPQGSAVLVRKEPKHFAGVIDVAQAHRYVAPSDVLSRILITLRDEQRKDLRLAWNLYLARGPEPAKRAPSPARAGAEVKATVIDLSKRKKGSPDTEW
ncbi:MAG: type IV secretion system DNA-binding domain-containing protein [Deltaproteobacteria bacterium]|nr:type IV secretion system DNA-binding domain-containing protein [Deltaproteobacteria bacterium]